MSLFRLAPTLVPSGLAILLVSACNFKDEKTSPEPVVVLDSNQIISFAEVKTTVLDPSCNSSSCHAATTGNSAGVSLETYAVVKTHLAAIKRTTVDGRSMPKGGTLSAEALALLRTWIEQGAPETK